MGRNSDALAVVCALQLLVRIFFAWIFLLTLTGLTNPGILVTLHIEIYPLTCILTQHDIRHDKGKACTLGPQRFSPDCLEPILTYLRSSELAVYGAIWSCARSWLCIYSHHSPAVILSD